MSFKGEKKSRVLKRLKEQSKKVKDILDDNNLKKSIPGEIKGKAEIKQFILKKLIAPALSTISILSLTGCRTNPQKEHEAPPSIEIAKDLESIEADEEHIIYDDSNYESSEFEGSTDSAVTSKTTETSTTTYNSEQTIPADVNGDNTADRKLIDVYSEPSLNSDVAESIPEYADVELCEIKKDDYGKKWCKIKLADGNEAWIQDKYYQCDWANCVSNRLFVKNGLNQNQSLKVKTVNQYGESTESLPYGYAFLDCSSFTYSGELFPNIYVADYDLETDTCTIVEKQNYQNEYNRLPSEGVQYKIYYVEGKYLDGLNPQYGYLSDTPSNNERQKDGYLYNGNPAKVIRVEGTDESYGQYIVVYKNMNGEEAIAEDASIYKDVDGTSLCNVEEDKDAHFKSTASSKIVSEREERE